MTQDELFAGSQQDFSTVEERLGPGSVLLRGFATGSGTELVGEVEAIARQSPFRQMVTPGGFVMSVAMTNCGELGWVTDRRGYRYERTDPVTGAAWPSLPPRFFSLAVSAAERAGYGSFVPDACLVNRYEPGAKMSLHQDKNEQDYEQPIVSVSLGLPATFQFGGFERADAVAKVTLAHGDVVVWGGPDRLRFHGVLPLKKGQHPVAGSYRYNLTFRKAG